MWLISGVFGVWYWYWLGVWVVGRDRNWLVWLGWGITGWRNWLVGLGRTGCGLWVWLGWEITG